MRIARIVRTVQIIHTCTYYSVFLMEQQTWEVRPPPGERLSNKKCRNYTGRELVVAVTPPISSSSSTNVHEAMHQENQDTTNDFIEFLKHSRLKYVELLEDQMLHTKFSYQDDHEQRMHKKSLLALIKGLECRIRNLERGECTTDGDISGAWCKAEIAGALRGATC